MLLLVHQSLAGQSPIKTGHGLGALATLSSVSSSNIANNSITNADINSSAAISDTKLATISTAGKVSNSATTATSSSVANTIVARDGSGNYSANIITAAKITGLSAPTAGSDCATKDYVDASSGGTTFAGYTPTTYDGNLGGQLGGSQKCHAAFPGSHMCEWKEIVTIPGFTATQIAWIRAEWNFSNGSIYQVFYQDGSAADNDGRGALCRGFRHNSSGYKGPVLSTTYGGIGSSNCDAFLSIACCY